MASIRESLAPARIRQLRILGLIERISFLLLLGIAMPLKYLAGLPQAVLPAGPFLIDGWLRQR